MLIPQRIKGEFTGGKKQEEHVEGYTNALNLSRAHLEKQYDQLKYSIEMPLVSSSFQDVSADDYRFFAQKFPHQEMLAPLLNFDTETDFFLSSLKSLSLREQLVKIEQYVRERGFADMKNAEVTELKR